MMDQRAEVEWQAWWVWAANLRITSNQCWRLNIHGEIERETQAIKWCLWKAIKWYNIWLRHLSNIWQAIKWCPWKEPTKPHVAQNLNPKSHINEGLQVFSFQQLDHVGRVEFFKQPSQKGILAYVWWDMNKMLDVCW